MYHGLKHWMSYQLNLNLSYNVKKMRLHNGSSAIYKPSTPWQRHDYKVFNVNAISRSSDGLEGWAGPFLMASVQDYHSVKNESPN